MLRGHNWSSSIDDSRVAPERLQQFRVRRSRRSTLPVWILVFLLCISLCSWNLPYAIEYLRAQFTPPHATPTQPGIIPHAPTPSPSPGPSPTPSPTPSPSPTPRPTATPVTSAVVNKQTDHYSGLILEGDIDDLQRAYGMLSSEQRQHVSFAQFKQNENYTLPKGCLRFLATNPATLEPDGVTWQTDVEVEYVPYGDTTVQTYDWHFQWRVEQGHLFIVGIGLYPTGVDPSASLPC
jgi:hypothetical protein